MGVRDKFRRRWLGSLGYTGGDPSLVDQPIITSAKDKAENNQTQRDGLYDRGYKLGQRPPRKLRTRR